MQLIHAWSRPPSNVIISIAYKKNQILNLSHKDFKTLKQDKIHQNVIDFFLKTNTAQNVMILDHNQVDNILKGKLVSEINDSEINQATLIIGQYWNGNSNIVVSNII